MSTTSCLENLSLEETKERFRQEKRRYRRLRRDDRRKTSALLIKALAERVNALQIQSFQDARRGLQAILVKLGEEFVKPSEEASFLRRLEFVHEQLAYVAYVEAILGGKSDFDSPSED